MAMVEVPDGSAVGGRSNHQSWPPRTTPFFLEVGRLTKAERRAIVKKTSPHQSPQVASRACQS
eukprot:scaffold4429_cov81-Cyclotella_meneghiniana.AAC.1